MAGGQGKNRLPRLLVPVELARVELEKLVTEGHYLLGDASGIQHDRHTTIVRGEKWQQLTANAEKWAHHTQRLLQHWFDQSELAQEFASPPGTGPLTYIGRSHTPYTEHEVAADLCYQVSVLETLVPRLGSYAIQVPDPAAKATSDSPLHRPDRAGGSYITYNIQGPVGQLVAGEGQSVKNINSHVAAVVGQGEPQLAVALQRLAEIAISDPELDQRTRGEVLEKIEDLAEAAEAEPQERKTGRIRGAIAVIGSAAGAATQLGQAWQQWGPVITQHLQLPSG